MADLNLLIIIRNLAVMNHAFNPIPPTLPLVHNPLKSLLIYL